MNLRHIAPLLLLVAGALAGCNTTESRIRQKNEVFASLPLADQTRLRRGEVAVGDTGDMVFIALGAPTRHRTHSTAEGSRTEWIYREYHQTYEGSRMVGYRRVVSFDPRTGRRFIHLEPEYASVYREQTEDRFRIIFENGRVSAIEEIKR
jgi:hypothetical protein